MNLIGRKNEIEKIDLLMRSGKPEFVAVYGRRRGGKTFLLREYFNYQFAFYASGSTEAKTNRQKLRLFHKALKEYGHTEKTPPVDWIEAFDRLKELLLSGSVHKDAATGRKVIFLDELPWFDTGKSDFRLALDIFWNTWASTQPDICLIICGSATSWIIDRVLMDRGGFHNRVTRQIHLRPFTLSECEEFLYAGGIQLPRGQIIKSYMVFGGIPYYLNLLDRRLSLDQNIQALVFEENGKLRDEYPALFNALFSSPGKHAQIIECLAGVRRGMSRTDLSKKTGINNGGSMSQALSELEQCGFIKEFSAYNKSSYGKMYQVTDPFVLFYTSFVKGKKIDSWMQFIGTPSYYEWQGIAFETVCLGHIDRIKQALGISGISANIYSWQSKAAGGKKGAQIDLLIDRADSTINLCEMKYTEKPFVIDEDYKNNLLNKRDLFRESTQTKKAVTIVMISANGVSNNAHYDISQRTISGSDLF